MSEVWKDARFAWRIFARNPAFTLVAVLSLSLGIGANTAIFSVFEKLQLERLPYRDPARLVMITEVPPKQEDGNGVCVANFLAFRDQNRVFESIGAGGFYSWANLTDVGTARALVGQHVTQGLLPTLGIKPALGRWFLEDDFSETAPPAVMISHRLWQQEFDSNPHIVGQKLSLDNKPQVIVGVMPAHFRAPSLLYFNDEVDFWKAFHISPLQAAGARRYLGVIGRLRPGVSLEEARANIEVLDAQLARAFPERNKGWSVLVRPMREAVTRSMREPMLILLGAVGFVLLIACANVAGLLLAQAQGRYREIAVRMAMGASRGRVIRQLLVESSLLGLAGGAGGVFLAWCGIRAMSLLAPAWDVMRGAGIPRVAEIELNPAVLLYALLISIGTVVVFGGAPAVQASHPNLNDGLKDAGRGSSEAFGRQRARSLAVLLEISLAIVLLSGAGLLINSFLRLENVDVGFHTDRLSVFDLHIPDSDRNYSEDAGTVDGFHQIRIKPRLRSLFRQVLEGLQGVPGVESAACVSVSPLSGFFYSSRVQVEGRPAPVDQEEAQWVGYANASPGVFRTLGIPVIRGRGIVEGDTATSPWVAVINQTMANSLWPGQDPLGKRFTLDEVDRGRLREVVGVMSDFRQSLDSTPWAQAYVPYTQVPAVQFAGSQPPLWMSFILRTSGDSSGLPRAIREVLKQADPNQAVIYSHTMGGMRATATKPLRFYMVLAAGFAAIALILAAVGIYGMIAYTVASRTHEIGIRMALGAHRGSVLRLVLKRGLLLAFGGTLLGLAGSLALTRLLSSVLYSVRPHDPLTLAAVVLVLNGAALLACYVPARRATRIDPVEALRHG
jgi:putative ABC transport system permease protein